MKTSFSPLLLGQALVLATLIFWLVAGQAQPAKVRWLLGESGASSQPFEEVDAETPFRLELQLHAEAHVYVVSHDLAHGCSALFPSEYLRSDIADNPLPPGTHTLPGKSTDFELFWQSGDATSPFSAMLIVSQDEIPGMRAAMARFRQMGNAAFPRKHLLGGYAPKAGMEQIPAAHELLHDAIEASHHLVDAQNDGPMIPWEGHPGIFLKVLRLKNRGRDLQPGADLQAQINADLSGLVHPGKPGK